MDHDGNSKQRYRRRDDKCNREANSPPHRGILALTVEEPALRPHNFRVRLISQPLGAYLVVAGRQWPLDRRRLVFTACARSSCTLV
jgi:hypothetical protein